MRHRHWLSLISILLLTGSLASGQGTITVSYLPNSVAGGGGTGTVGYPYAAHVSIQGWTGAASSQAYLKIYSGSNNEYMWAATNVWSNTTTYANTNQPVVDIDAGGNWSGWIYAKHSDPLGASVQVRARKIPTSPTIQLTTTAVTLTILNMTTSGNGGWLVRTTSPAVNKGIVAYLGSAVVGTYKTEDNGVTEGYSYGSGGFKIAVPVGFVDSLVSYNDDGSRDQVFIGPWTISAGQETDASVGGGVIGRGTARITPSTLSGNVSHSMSLKIFGQSPYTITDAKVVVPETWSWPQSSGNVTLVGGGSPVAGVSGDTISISGLTLPGGDSLEVQLSEMTPADSTFNFVFKTLTGTHPDSIYAIGTQPTVFVYSTPLSIAVAKENDSQGVPLRLNTLVTVRGIVTVANQFGGPSYIQDNSGGFGIFGSSFSSAVTIGDEVIVSGLVQPFGGLSEIVNPVLHSIVSTGNITDPLLANAAQIFGDGVGGVEVYEGMLVRLNSVTVTGTGTWTANTNYPLNDVSGSTQLRIDNTTNLVGAPIPAGTFDLIAVVGQFISTPPFIGGYQLLPRFTEDVISAGPIFATFPTETSILPTSLTINWQTINGGTTYARYGLTPAFELGLVGDDTIRTDHTVVLPGLTPATVYYIKAFSVAAAETSSSSTLISCTASSAAATGQMNAYFNKSVNTNLAWFQNANGNTNLLSRLIPRIDQAQRSIDVAVYSLSGTVGDNIAAALVNAKNRGVNVRVICEYDNSTSNAFNFLLSNSVPLINDRFDAVNNGAGLHHNKFFVFDGRGGAPESVWVWTGSWNPTDPGTNSDYQNAIEIQDPALANAFTLEFNEMWGSNTQVPNAGVSRFGARKTDNTPHRFVIGGKNVECYFSPSDRTSSKIIGVINGAQHSVNFALLTLTRSEIATAILNRHQAFLDVRGLLDNGTDQGSQYNYLLSNGVDMHLNTGGGLLHHKYGIIDAENPNWNSVTITGSHNWTSAAENSNGENALVVHDGNIANQYLQEFAARYYQLGGTDSILVSVEQVTDAVPERFSLSQNYPNPFNPKTVIEFRVANSELVSLKVYDILGREVATLVNERLVAGTYSADFNATALASGVYFYRLEAGKFVEMRKMLLLK